MAVFVATVLAVLVLPASRQHSVAKAEHGRGWAGHLVRQYHVAAWVRRNESKLIRFGRDLAGPALTVGKGAVSLLAALAAAFVLVVPARPAVRPPVTCQVTA
jgi:hypothetical protein